MSFIPQPEDSLKLKPLGQRYLYSSTPYFWTLPELDRLKELVGKLELKAATVKNMAGPEQHDESRRRSNVAFIEPDADSAWVFQKIGDAIRHHNQAYYNYDITGIEHVQFTEYPAGEGYYKPHLDWGAGMIMGRGDICRKLSFTIQLSDPKSYEGGDFRVCDGSDFSEQSLKLREFGTIIVFPSWVLHEVTPVTVGTRRSLVGWCLGPDFK
jgi:PKHD-type hydroxylase